MAAALAMFMVAAPVLAADGGEAEVPALSAEQLAANLFFNLCLNPQLAGQDLAVIEQVTAQGFAPLTAQSVVGEGETLAAGTRAWSVPEASLVARSVFITSVPAQSCELHVGSIDALALRDYFEGVIETHDAVFERYAHEVSQGPFVLSGYAVDGIEGRYHVSFLRRVEAVMSEGTPPDIIMTATRLAAEPNAAPQQQD